MGLLNVDGQEIMLKIATRKATDDMNEEAIVHVFAVVQSVEISTLKYYFNARNLHVTFYAWT